jgi:hypothetical protein
VQRDAEKAVFFFKKNLDSTSLLNPSVTSSAPSPPLCPVVDSLPPSSTRTAPAEANGGKTSRLVLSVSPRIYEPDLFVSTSV